MRVLFQRLDGRFGFGLGSDALGESCLFSFSGVAYPRKSLERRFALAARSLETPPSSMPSRPEVKPGLTSREVEDLYSSYRDANRFIAAKRDASPGRLRKDGERAVDLLEAAAAAAAVGFLAGRMGTTQTRPL